MGTHRARPKRIPGMGFKDSALLVDTLAWRRQRFEQLRRLWQEKITNKEVPLDRLGSGS